MSNNKFKKRPTTQISEFLPGIPESEFLPGKFPPAPLPAGTPCSICGDVIKKNAKYFCFSNYDNAITCQKCVEIKRNAILQELQDSQG